jgi:hypothetical protein
MNPRTATSLHMSHQTGSGSVLPIWSYCTDSIRLHVAVIAGLFIFDEYFIHGQELVDAGRIGTLFAKTPPPLPAFTVIPIALVDVAHFVGDSVKALDPASCKNLSNSIGIKLGLPGRASLYLLSPCVAALYPVIKGYLLPCAPFGIFRVNVI